MEGLARALQQVERTYVLVNRRKLSYFGGCDYFRLSSHPVVLKAVHEGLTKFGLNVSASRTTTGNHKVYEELEELLADFFEMPSATLVSSGYATNLVVGQALMGNFSHAVVDAKAHGSLLDAAHFFDCPVFRFEHNNLQSLVDLLRQTNICLSPVLLTDGVLANDGSIAPLAAYLDLLPREGFLMVDDAHGAGVVGKNGQGSIEAAGVDKRRVILTITLSKAFGVYGGAVLGPKELSRKIITRSRLFIGNTPVPLPLAAGAIAAVKYLKENAALRQKLKANVDYVKESLAQGSVPAHNNAAPIISFLPRSKRDILLFKAELTKRKIHPPLIYYPGGPETGYFRFALSSEHTRAQLDGLIEAIVEWHHYPQRPTIKETK